MTFKNAGDVVNGPVALRQALSVSSDVYFYRLGQEANGTGNGLLIQNWARGSGSGGRTGIDLPGEAPGLVPTPKYRNEGFAATDAAWQGEADPEEISLGECGFLDRPWSVGDNINLSVGQGDLQANPLQMAVAYAAIANGGRVVRPRLGQRIEDAERARRCRSSRRRRARKLEDQARVPPGDPGRACAARPASRAAPRRRVFAGFPIPIAGKTGTAEKGAGRADQSWYVALAPYPNPKYVVAVTFEAGRLRRRDRRPGRARDPRRAVRRQGEADARPEGR